MQLLIYAAAMLMSGQAATAVPAGPAKAMVEEARTLLSSGKEEEAIRLFKEAVRLDPRNAVAHNALGSLLNQSGRYTEALPHAVAAARLEPANMRYRYNRGVVLAEHGRFAEALADFDAALSAHPDNIYGWLERGAVRLSLGDHGGAKADWKRAQEADPKLIWPHWYSATGDFVEGRYAQAAAGFDRVAAAEPEFIPAKLWRIIAHGRAGTPLAVDAGTTEDWPAAVIDFWRRGTGAETLVKAAAADRTTGDRRREAEALFFAAQRCLVDGRRTEARELLRRALAIPAPRHVWRIAAERDLAALEGA